MKKSRRRTSKVWLGISMSLSFVALFYALSMGLETAAVGITVLIPAVYGAYTTIGHMDLRTLSQEASSALSADP